MRSGWICSGSAIALREKEALFMKKPLQPHILKNITVRNGSIIAPHEFKPRPLPLHRDRSAAVRVKVQTVTVPAPHHGRSSKTSSWEREAPAKPSTSLCYGLLSLPRRTWLPTQEDTGEILERFLSAQPIFGSIF